MKRVVNVEKGRISVIVPVYNVEAYLHQCLDSIVNQTYRNLEIFLVDDGSPDNCGAICDEYAAKDDRIIVIHQENAGQAAARNAGLDVATGDYIGFVDSDDWIEPNMFEMLLQQLQLARADAAICGILEECPNRVLFCGVSERRVLEKEESLRALIEEDSISSSVWDTLWKRELFREIRFPVGRKYEDAAVQHRLLEQTNRVVQIPDGLYHYRINPNGTMANISLHSRYDLVTMAQQRYADLAENWPQFAEILACRCIEAAVPLWTVYYQNPRDVRRQYLPKLQELAEYAKPRISAAVKTTNLGAAGRLALRLIPHAAWWSFALAGVIGWLYQKRHGRVL